MRRVKTFPAWLLALCFLLPGCATRTNSLPEGDGSESEHTLFAALYKAVPEMHSQNLELLCLTDISFPHLGDWQQGGRILAFFRYRADPEHRSRLLILRRTFPMDGTDPSLFVELCHARKHSFYTGGTDAWIEVRWIIMDRKLYTRTP